MTHQVFFLCAFLDLRLILTERPSRDISSSSLEINHVTEEGLVESIRLDDELQRVASTLPEGPTKSLLQSFKICASCNNWKRFGSPHDGGYLMCMDRLKKGHTTAALSLGVNDDDQWAADVQRGLSVPVHQFDCTVSEAPIGQCRECHFHRICLAGPNGEGAPLGKSSATLAEIVGMVSGGKQPDRRSLVMKMDISGAEWPVLAASHEGLDTFNQLVFEFHSLDREQKHPEYLMAMQNLASAGFQVLHIHGNNWGGVYSKDGYSIPSVLEVTLTSEDEPSPACQQQRRLDLDAANNRNNADLANAVLPP